MKRILPAIFCLFYCISLQAQTGFTCATARVISSLPYQDTYTTCGSGNEIGAGTCNPTYSSGEDVVYQINITTAPITLFLEGSNITTTAGTPNIGVSVSSTCTFATCILNGTATGSFNTTVTFPTNGTYYIRFDAWSTPCYTYKLGLFAAPSNDLICNATNVVVNSGCMLGTNAQSTKTAASDGASCITENNTVWYSFAASDDSITVSLDNGGTLTYSEIAVFGSSNNSCAGTLTQIACVSGAGGQSCTTCGLLNLTGLVIGNTYFIMVDGSSTGTGIGSYCISVTETQPLPPDFGATCEYPRILYPYTDCTVTTSNGYGYNELQMTWSGAVVVTYSASTLDAVNHPVNSLEASCAGTDIGQKPTWAKFKATSTTTTLTNSAGTGSLDYAVYTGVCGALTSVNCYTLANGTSASFATVSGIDYLVMITAAGASATTTHSLCVTSTPGYPGNPNDDCTNALTMTDGVIYNLNNAHATADNVVLCSGSTEDDIWTKWTCPLTWNPNDKAFVHLSNENCNNPTGVQLSMFSSSYSCPQLTSGSTLNCEVFINSRTNGNFYGIWQPIPGKTYYIVVDGLAGTVCNFDLQINNNSTTVPISLLYFTGTNRGDYNQLRWATASEINSNYFLIEKSTDGREFTEIGRLSAAGNSNNTVNYHYNDNKPQAVTYYRFKEYDYDGAYTYSNIISVTARSKFVIKDIFPNPASTKLNFSIEGAEADQEVHIEIMNVMGQILLNKDLPSSTEPQSLNIENLEQGVYFLKVKSGEDLTEIKKFVKN